MPPVETEHFFGPDSALNQQHHDDFPDCSQQSIRSIDIEDPQVKSSKTLVTNEKERSREVYGVVNKSGPI